MGRSKYWYQLVDYILERGYNLHLVKDYDVAGRIYYLRKDVFIRIDDDNTMIKTLIHELGHSFYNGHTEYNAVIFGYIFIIKHMNIPISLREWLEFNKNDIRDKQYQFLMENL